MGTTPRGWYDVGDGWAGMWDGEQWTGERISHEQLAALTRPPAPPPPVNPPPPTTRPVGRPSTPPPRWLIYLGITLLVGFVGLAIAGALLDEPDTAPLRPTTRTAPPDPPLELTRAKREAAEACRLEESSEWFIGVPVPLSGTGPCADVAYALAARFGFTAAEVDRALAATENDRPVRIERGGWFMVNDDDTLTSSLLWFSSTR